jgi:hypothetical protein
MSGHSWYSCPLWTPLHSYSVHLLSQDNNNAVNTFLFPIQTTISVSRRNTFN